MTTTSNSKRMFGMEISGDEVADVVLKEFDKLPAKRRPIARGKGVREWVPLSGIVVQGFIPEIAGCRS